MFGFHLQADLPRFAQITHKYRSVIWRNWQFTNKFIEIESDFRSTTELFNIDIDVTLSGQDHAGIELEFGLLGFRFAICFRDQRHWDHKKKAWEDAIVEEVSAEDADASHSLHASVPADDR